MTKKYGLIGSGMMGQEHIRNLALLDGAKLEAVFEPDDTMAAQAAELVQDVIRVDSIADMLRLADLDALIIASPNFCHADQIAEIATTRPLPLLVEKPLFTDPDDIERLDSIAATFPAPIWVAMEYRYMPPVAAFLEQADVATGGVSMLSVREHRFPFLPKVGDWNRFNKFTGGTLVEKCCHFFDLMRLTLKDEPVRIMASAGQAVNHLDEDYDGKVPDIIDSAFVIVEFAKGARAMLDLCMFAEGAQYQEELSATGPLGKIEALVPGPGRFWPHDLGPAPEPMLIQSPRTPKRPIRTPIPVDPALLDAGDHNGSTFYQHQEFLALLNNQRAAPAVTYSDGRAAVMMGLAAQRSATLGQAVTF